MLATCLVGLGLLGAAGLAITAMPAIGIEVSAPALVAWGFELARRELRRPRHALVLRADGVAHCDGSPVDAITIDGQGPLMRLAWRSGGRTVRWAAWPDVLDAARRRELRLWRDRHGADACTAPVAP